MPITRQFAARYSGQCVECGGPVQAGEQVNGTKDDSQERGRWLISHVVCPQTAPGAVVAPAATHIPFPPTDEQANILRLVATRENVVAQAGAGTGKTVTLKFIANWMAENGLTGAYRAFNRRIVDDTAKDINGCVNCRTMHADALAALPYFQARLPGGKAAITRQHGEEQARILGIGPFIYETGEGVRRMAPGWVASRVMGAVRNYCRSEDDDIGRHHVDYVDGIDEPNAATGRRGWANNDRLAAYLLPFVRAAWADLSAPVGGLRFWHDVYLKVWSLGNPIIDGDVLLIDEAQDTDAVQMVVIRKQAARGMQVITVGDEMQTIYDWRGAVDAMAEFEAQGAKVAFLAQSFRFGDAVAEVANGLLSRLDARLRLRGYGPVASTVGPIAEPDAILCRTNAGTIRVLLAQIAAERRAALFGAVDEIASFMKGALALQAGRSSTNPELACFSNWAAVQRYVETEPDGQDLKLMVNLVDEFGAAAILDAVENQPRPEDADVVISTAHKTKGLQWPRVQIGPDFRAPAEEGEDLPPAELRLAYVACTRAQFELDLSAAPHFAPGWAP